MQGLFDSQRSAAIDILRKYGEATIAALTPNSTSPPTDYAVFAFRDPICLAHGGDKQQNYAVAVQRLTLLSDFLRVTPSGYTYCLPGRGDLTLSPNESLNKDLAPNILSYAARAYTDTASEEESIQRAIGLWKTLHDQYQGANGGFVTQWNPKTGMSSGRITQASLIYPWASSGFRMFKVVDAKENSKFLEVHNMALRRSTDVAFAMLRNGRLPIEQLDAATLTPIEEGTYGQSNPTVILGHYAQLLNFILRSLEHSGTGSRNVLPEIKNQFEYLLSNYVSKSTGGIGNGYDQESGNPVEPWGHNLAYWQQTEFIAALNRAFALDVFEADDALLELAQKCYLGAIGLLGKYFDNGAPVAAVLDRTGKPIDEEKNVIPFILPYHTVDLLDQIDEST